MIGPSMALLAGLALLAWSADHLVIGAARLALALRMSAVVIGATVIGLGTSAPELLISALAAAEGSVEIAAGNLIGSNIANVALVTAVAALIAPLQISSETLRREAPLSALAVISFAIALATGLTRLSGALLLLALPLAVTWIVRSRRRGHDSLGAQPQAAGARSADIGRDARRTVLALVGIAAGAQLVVSGAEDIAAESGIREGFVGLTVVAIGTSLPELVTAIQAARRDHPDLIVGNVLGSNLFNSLAAGGLIAVLAPGPLSDPDLTGLAMVAMVGSALVAWLLLTTGRRLTRCEAALLLAAYLAMLPLLSR